MHLFFVRKIFLTAVSEFRKKMAEEKTQVAENKMLTTLLDLGEQLDSISVLQCMRILFGDSSLQEKLGYGQHNFVAELQKGLIESLRVDPPLASFINFMRMKTGRIILEMHDSRIKADKNDIYTLVDYIFKERQSMYPNLFVDPSPFARLFFGIDLNLTQKILDDQKSRCGKQQFQRCEVDHLELTALLRQVNEEDKTFVAMNMIMRIGKLSAENIALHAQVAQLQNQFKALAAHVGFNPQAAAADMKGGGVDQKSTPQLMVATKAVVMGGGNASAAAPAEATAAAGTAPTAAPKATAKLQHS